MNMAEAFPGKWLKAGHLKGDTHITITGFRMGRYEDGNPAPELSIKEPIGGNTDMALGLNKTNWKSIAKLYGDNTDAWIGKRITLHAQNVRVGPKMEPGIRVKGSPDLQAPLTFDLRLPRKRPIQTTLVPTGKQAAAEPAAEPEPA